MTTTPKAARAKKPKSSRRPGGFQPPHCPNPQCRFHNPSPHWRFVRCGAHIRKRDNRRVQDYQCVTCHRQFSAPTFATTYWLKRPELLAKVAALITEGAGIRQAARVLSTSPSTVVRMTARLGRHGMLFHEKRMKEAKISEPLAIDGFETFEYSQYFPYHINLAVGSESWFVYYFTDSPLRRKGRMTPEQKEKRAELEACLGRPHPKAVQWGIASLLRPLMGKVTGPFLDLRSDDHPAYPRALRQLRQEGITEPDIVHQITSSKDRRTTANPLFPVNLTDLLLRHGSANHRRETIAFSKRRQGGLERCGVFLIWRNYVKRRREKDHPQGETAAMWVGAADRPLRWRDILKRRLFPSRIELTREWRQYYERKVKTLILGDRQTEHRLKYAF